MMNKPAEMTIEAPFFHAQPTKARVWIHSYDPIGQAAVDVRNVAVFMMGLGLPNWEVVYVVRALEANRECKVSVPNALYRFFPNNTAGGVR